MRFKSPKHLAWIRTHQCAVHSPDCSGPIDAHHTKTRGSGGGDDGAVPLCRFHHSQFHNKGRVTFDRMHGVKLIDVAAEYYNRSPYRSEE